MIYKVLQSYCMLLPLCQSKKTSTLSLFHCSALHWPWIWTSGWTSQRPATNKSAVLWTLFNEHSYVNLPLRRREKREMMDAFHSSREGSWWIFSFISCSFRAVRCAVRACSRCADNACQEDVLPMKTGQTHLPWHGLVQKSSGALETL